MSRLPRAPASRSYSRLLYCVAVRRNSSTTDSESGARPRFVCRMTPVALMTGCSECARIRSTHSAIVPSISPTERTATTLAASSPAMRPRRSASTARATSTTTLRSTRFESAARRGWRSNSSTEGIWRRSSACSAEIARLARASMATFQHRADGRAMPGACLWEQEGENGPEGCRMRTGENVKGLTPSLCTSSIVVRIRIAVRGAPPHMATIDEDLATVEKDIRQLKVEYDQYLGGGRKRPPSEIEWRIDLLLKRYAEQVDAP